MAEDQMLDVLKKKFHLTNFRTGQKETIDSILNGYNTLGILPTGSGKSLCYQLPSYFFEGSTLIVSPLLSLMEDQVFQCYQRNEKSVIMINSSLSYSEKIQALDHLNEYKFIFMSPEMLLQDNVLRKLTASNITLFVVDEAHCISQWGIDFRPEYTQFGKVQSILKDPVTIALTATASEQIKKDICMHLFSHSKRKNQSFSYSVNRSNIAYQVMKVQNKEEAVLQFVTNLAGSGIIYFSSRKKAEEIACFLNRKSNKKIAVYHGMLTSQDRSKIQQQFLADQVDVLCATNAFGMGVNKPNVRYVIHYHLASSIEAYLQETGRAGRDGCASQATLLYKKGDESIHYHLQKEAWEDYKTLHSLLTTKSVPEQKKVLNQVNDVQRKWLERVHAKEISKLELESLLNRKMEEKKLQLNEVLAYIHLDSCRREFLLQHFNENQLELNPICCDICGFPDEYLFEIHDHLEKNRKSTENWKILLKNLFLTEF